MNRKLITLTAFAMGLNITALHAQESDALLANSGKSQGFFVYGDYFQYKGAGAPGRLVNEELSLNQTIFIADVLQSGLGATTRASIGDTPTGDLTGGTLGYTWNDASGNQHLIQGGYRSGTIDETYDVVAAIDNSWRVTNDFEQDTDEYRIMYSFSPAKYNFLTLGIEYVYSSSDATFETTGTGALTPWGEGQYWKYGYESEAHDLLVHVTLKAPVLPLIETRTGGLSLLPRFDVGLGYSWRDGDLIEGPGSNDVFVTEEAKEILNDDAFILETTATVGLSYVHNASRFNVELGYRYKTDLDSDKNGTTQEGFYARAGYSYSW